MVESDDMKTFTRTDYKMILATSTDYLSMSTTNVAVKNDAEFKAMLNAFDGMGWVLMDTESQSMSQYTDDSTIYVSTQICAYLWKKHADLCGDVNKVRKQLANAI